MGKELTELSWVEELLPEGTIKKSMFGGFSYYWNEKLVLLMFEDTSTSTYRGKKYPFAIWNGCMFPAEKEQHALILKQFDFLVSHPVLPKWLYLPLESEDFEQNAQTLLRELRRHNPLFGTIPKSKAKKTRGQKNNSAKTKSEKIEKFENIDTRRPRMFSDEPSESVFDKAKKLSDLKNLGPETEKVLLKAGIKTPAQLKKLGWQKTMRKLCKVDPKNNHAVLAYAIIGALTNKMWNLISEEDKEEARKLTKTLRGKTAKEAPQKNKKRKV